MQSIKDKYPGIDNPIILKLLEILPNQQQFLEEQRRKRAEKLAFQKSVFGEAIKELYEFSPFKELKEKADQDKADEELSRDK